MKLEPLINNFKHIIFIAVPLSIAMTYVGVLSFYFNYNINISTYLGFEDLTIIYSKYTILSLIYLLIIYFGAKKIFKENDHVGYWDNTIYSTVIKRRVILYLIILGFIIYAMIISETLRIFLSILLISLAMISFVKFSINNLFFVSENFSDKIKNEESIVASILAFLFGLFLISFAVGFHGKRIVTNESVIIHLENGSIVDAQKISNLKFIGKTSSFVFIQDSINNRTMVYPIDKVSEIEYCDSN